MKPTREQEHALALFGAQETCALNAYAGAGKTSTLALMAKSTTKRGLYLAFNRAIAQEAKNSFPSHVTVKTSHALAFHAVRQRGYSSEKMTGLLNAHAIASIIQTKALSFDDFELSRTDIALGVRSALKRFALSMDNDISTAHVVREGVLQRLTKSQWRKYANTVVSHTRNLWMQMIDPRASDVFLGHDGYFKLWSISEPQLDYAYILIDEAQDSNPALLSVLQKQDAPVVFVGDRFQQIYGWRGAVNAMESLEHAQTAYLTKSFRFGDAIADAASSVLHLLDNSVHIRGVEKESRLSCDTPDVVLARTNSGLVRDIIEARDNGTSFHIVGGTAELELMLRDVTKLKAGRKATHSEFYGFKSWQQVQLFAQNTPKNPLGTFVRLVDEYSEDALLSILAENVTHAKNAEMCFSTVHKAKGLEFDNVVLSDDFPAPAQVKQNQKLHSAKNSPDSMRVERQGHQFDILIEEIRILYVAMTRARSQVALPHWCYSFFELDEPSHQSTVTDVPTQATKINRTGATMERYAVIDFETSGLSPNNGDRAIEIGVVLIENGRIVDSYDSLMNSDVTIYSHIEELTGISQSMIARAPDAEAVMRDAHAFIGDAQLVAHNASFDKKFWESESRRALGQAVRSDFLCTLLISRRLYQTLPSYKLGNLATHLGVTNRQHHRALGDATATAEIFVQASRSIEQTYAPSSDLISFLKKFQTTPKKKLEHLHESVQGAIKPKVPKPSQPSRSTHQDVEVLDTAALSTADIQISAPEKIFYKNGSLRGLHVHMHHRVLELEKTIAGRDSVLLEQKILNQKNSWEKKAKSANRRLQKQQVQNEIGVLERQAENMTQEAQDYIASLRDILKHTLSIDDTIDWGQLRDLRTFSIESEGTSRITYDATGCPIDIAYVTFTQPQPEPPAVQPEPQRAAFEREVTLWEKIRFQSAEIAKTSEDNYRAALGVWRDDKMEQERLYEEALAQWNATANDVNRQNEELYRVSQVQVREWKEAYELHTTRAAKINQKVDALQAQYADREPEAVEEYSTMVLTNSHYPEHFPQNFTADYEKEGRRLIVNYHLPSIDDLSFLESATVVKSRKEIKEKYHTKTAQKEIYSGVVEQVALRSIHELFEADAADALNTVVFNGFICVIDEAVGHDKTVCIASIECTKTEFMDIDLARVEPTKCYEHLGGRGSARTYLSEKEVVKYAETSEATFVSTRDVDLYI